jgi:hypothetical protein
MLLKFLIHSILLLIYKKIQGVIRMDFHKLYATTSEKIDRMVLYAPNEFLHSDSLISAAQDTFGNKVSFGIESYILIYFRFIKKNNEYEILFSDDGILNKIINHKESYESGQIKSIRVSDGKKVEKKDSVKFIMQDVLQNDIFGIRSDLDSGFFVVIINVIFDDKKIPTDEIRSRLRFLFDRHITSGM